MAIARDTTSTGTTSFSHTCSGSNRVLFVPVNTGLVPTNPTVSATYNGVSMTEVQRTNDTNTYTILFMLVNPASGTNTVAVTSSGTVYAAGGFSYTGCKQTGQPDASGVGSGSSISSLSTNLSVVGSNCWIVQIASARDGTTSAGTGYTEFGTNLPQTYFHFFDTNGTVSAGTNAVAFNGSQSTSLCHAFASISPAVAANTTNFFNMM